MADVPVNLLHHVPAAVIVSSAVRNSSDKPAHLVDGDMTTAWGSRTGDLTTASIVLFLPPKVQVQALALTSGFSQDRRGRDLFTQNHRVTAVSVYHNSEPLGRFPLDPNNRDLQQIPINRSGGYYRIEVAAVKAGSMPRWQEVCISELQVLGPLPRGATKEPRLRPTVQVDSPVPEDFVQNPRTAPSGPYGSIASFCRGWHGIIDRYFKSDPSTRIPPGPLLYPPDAPYCREDTKVLGSAITMARESGPFSHARIIQLAGQTEIYHALAMLTPRGYYFYAFDVLDSYDNPHCNGSSEFKADSLAARAITGGGAELSLRYREVITQASESGADKVRAEKRRVTCTWTGSDLTCMRE